jgi:hypothetical protein
MKKISLSMFAILITASSVIALDKVVAKKAIKTASHKSMKKGTCPKSCTKKGC